MEPQETWDRERCCNEQGECDRRDREHGEMRELLEIMAKRNPKPTNPTYSVTMRARALLARIEAAPPELDGSWARKYRIENPPEPDIDYPPKEDT